MFCPSSVVLYWMGMDIQNFDSECRCMNSWNLTQLLFIYAYRAKEEETKQSEGWILQGDGCIRGWYGGWRSRYGRCNRTAIPYSFNSLQWRHTQTHSAHLIIAHVAPLRWRVYLHDQSRISAGVRKSLIYAPTSLQWVKWIGYSCVSLVQYGQNIGTLSGLVDQLLHAPSLPPIRPNQCWLVC